MKKISLVVLVLILGLSLYSSMRPSYSTCQQGINGPCSRKTFVGIDFLLGRVGYISHIYHHDGPTIFEPSNFGYDPSIAFQARPMVEQTESGFGYGLSVIFDKRNKSLSFEGKNAPFPHNDFYWSSVINRILP